MSQQSDAVRTAKQTAIETTIGTSPYLQIFAGAAMPANCATADAGTLIAEGQLPADWSTQAAGVLTMAGTWTATGVSPGGYGRYWRIKNTAKTTCHWQGLLSEPWTASKAYVLGMHAHNGGNVYVCTTAGTAAASGGPTGTGTGITDGTAVWAYAGAVDMTIDNTNIATAQSVPVNTFTNTDGNA